MLARLTPQAHALGGYFKLLADGQAFPALIPELGILLAFSALFLTIATRRFRHSCAWGGWTHDAYGDPRPRPDRRRLGGLV